MRGHGWPRACPGGRSLALPQVLRSPRASCPGSRRRLQRGLPSTIGLSLSPIRSPYRSRAVENARITSALSRSSFIARSTYGRTVSAFVSKVSSSLRLRHEVRLLSQSSAGEARPRPWPVCAAICLPGVPNPDRMRGVAVERRADAPRTGLSGFEAPAGWKVVRQPELPVAASDGKVNLVQTQQFTLEKPYRTAIFAKAAHEARPGWRPRSPSSSPAARLEKRATRQIAGRKTRYYRIVYGPGKIEEIAFVLVDRNEIPGALPPRFLVARRRLALSSSAPSPSPPT